jgi:putative ABC transport system permease protein
MKPTNHFPPPRWAAWVLGRLLPDDAGTPAGDYEEYFNSIAQTEGVFAAKRWYVAQLLRLIPEIIAAKLYWNIVMWKNYLLVGRRNLAKNKTASAINLFGMSVAVASCVAAFLFVKDFATVDRFHENGDRIYTITHEVEENGGIARWGNSPAPLGPELAASFPQIEASVRLSRSQAVVAYGDIVVSEAVLFADPQFFDLFSFNLKLGTKESFQKESTVIISERTAEKFFGSKNPMGEVLSLSFAGNPEQAYVVGGVANAFPSNASFKFDVLISSENASGFGRSGEGDWGQFVGGTFIMLAPGASLDPIREAMPQFVTRQNAANEDWQILRYDFENLRSKGFTAFLIRGRVNYATEWSFMTVFIAIPLFMLALSCINYVNITLASALRRLKEIGIRKVIGGSREQIVFQFIAENLILCFLALIAGVILAGLVLVPVFNTLFVEQISMSLATDFSLWIFLLLLLLGIGLISGAYPALYISSFEPSSILRGHDKVTRKAWLTRSLMTVQFALAFITVVVSVYLASNNEHLLTVDWGYAPDNTLVVSLEGQNDFRILEAELSQYPGVQLVAGAQHHIGRDGSSARVNVDGVDKTVRKIAIGDSYFESMGIKVASGREFERGRTGLDSVSVVVNRAFEQDAGWDDATEHSIRLDGRDVSVIGVIDNVLVMPFTSEIPIIFTKAATESFSVATLKVPAGFDTKLIDDIWKKLFPGKKATYLFQNEVFDISYNSMKKLNRAFVAIALLSLMIACMGLFGLASQNAATRMKEMAVRKSLGASGANLAYELNRKFVVLLGVAAIFASLLCFFGINGLLGLVPNENLPLGPLPIIFALMLMFSTAGAAVFYQSRKIALINPAEVLKLE